MPYKPGDHYVVCDICGLKYYRSKCRKNWKNQVVCEGCYDGPRDPLDFPPRMRRERIAVRDARPEGNVAPTIIETKEPSSVTSESAFTGGNVTNDGGATVTAYGVCYGLDTAPALEDNYTEDGTGTGEFTSSLTGLTPNTRYFVRAYATNSVGTAYGPTRQFTTRP